MIVAFATDISKLLEIVVMASSLFVGETNHFGGRLRVARHISQSTAQHVDVDIRVVLLIYDDVGLRS